MTGPAAQAAAGTHDRTVGELLQWDVVERHLAEPFIERPWLARRVERHFADAQTRFVFVEGDAGLGKSTLAAWLTTRHRVSPRYFIRADSLMPHSAFNAVELLMSIGYQLTALRPDLFASEEPYIEVVMDVGTAGAGSQVTGARLKHLAVNPFRRMAQMIRVRQRVDRLEGELTGIEVERLTADPRLLDPAHLQELALLTPARKLRQLDPPAQIVLIIDALDEADQQLASGYSVSDWLANCPALPDNVRVVVTTRPHDGLRTVLRRQHGRARHEILLATDAEAVRDVSAYADQVARDQALVAAVARCGVALGDAARSAAVHAAGNFLYIVSWHRALSVSVEDGRAEDITALADLSVLPAGHLDQLYGFLLDQARRRAGATAWPLIHLRLLGTLAVAREPLTERQLFSWSGVADDGTAGGALHGLRQLLAGGARPGTRTLFHTSIGRFLHSAPQTGSYYVDPVEQHRRIADQLIAAHGHDWLGCPDTYALDHVAAHLIASLTSSDTDRADQLQCAESLTHLFEDQGYITRRTQGATHLLLADALAASHALGRFPTGYRDRLAHAIAVEAVTGEGGGSASPLRADALHATLAYRDDAVSFYDAVLAHATRADFVTAALVGSGDTDAAAVTGPVLAAFLDLRAGRLRRAGEVELAEELMREAAADASVSPRTQARRLYDQGYSAFLRGAPAEAHMALLRSADAAREADDEVGHYVARLIADQIAYYQGQLGALDYERELLDGLRVLQEADRSPGTLAERWLMNCQALLFDLAVLEGDRQAAEELWPALRDDAWVDRAVGPLYRTRWRARLALLREEWARACTEYETLLGPNVLTENPVRGSEGIARDLLDYGLALHGAGRPEDARQAWHQALSSPDTTAAWPWKPRARALLGED
ncbi:hypothetical protein [Streptomyces albipurpureus]|uniref:ATP-binding protein n=1 Tax=Streptomyces albipurpureus TaxID=2897419 RepID=A0ABT0UPI2_9ACTN|nr:hypothetical protein [Streptomyces sp. CWNU-1]MCM2390522.1 hypothetical protein [Streptomyces sp. CWNU-1]